MRLEELINEHQQDLNQTDMVIWKYIYNHRDKVRHISIHELAKACTVSSTTVVRFAQKLGLDGFGELKAIMKMEQPQKTAYHTNVMQSMEDFYQHTWSTLMKQNYDEANRLLHEANRVFTFASGCVQSNVVQEMKRTFFYGDVLIYEIAGKDEFYQIVNELTPDDLFIMVSLSGESEHVTDFSRQLKLKDVPLISITQLHENTLASLSTVNLYISLAKFCVDEESVTGAQFTSMLPYFLLLEIWYVKFRMYVSSLREPS